MSHMQVGLLCVDTSALPLGFSVCSLRKRKQAQTGGKPWMDIFSFLLIVIHTVVKLVHPFVVTKFNSEEEKNSYETFKKDILRGDL